MSDKFSVQDDSNESVKHLNEILSLVRETYSQIPDESSKQLGERVCEKVNQIYSKPPIRCLEWLQFVATSSSNKLSTISSNLSDSSSFLSSFTTNTFFPSLTDTEARQIIFNPSTEKDARIFSLSLFFLFFDSKDNSNNDIEELRKFSLFLLSLIFLVYKKRLDFLKLFILEGGLIPLVELLSHNNIYERSQALEILLSLTDNDLYDWFKEDEGLPEKERQMLLNSLLSIAFVHSSRKPSEFSLPYKEQLKSINNEFFLPFSFQDIMIDSSSSSSVTISNNFLLKCLWARDNWSENYMSMRVLQLLAMLSSLFRLKFSLNDSDMDPSKTFLVNFSSDFMDQLKLWSNKDKISSEEVSEEIGEEAKLALTLFDDFNKNKHDTLSENKQNKLNAIHYFLLPPTISLKNLEQTNRSTYNIVNHFNIFYNLLIKYDKISKFYNEIYTQNNNNSYIEYLIKNDYYNFSFISGQLKSFKESEENQICELLDSFSIVKFATNLKELGNSYFKKYQYTNSIQAYEKSSLSLLVFLHKFEQEIVKTGKFNSDLLTKLKKEIIQLLVILYNNLSNSYWKLHFDAIKEDNINKLQEQTYLSLSELYSIHSIYLNPTNSKACYRYVLVLLEKNQIDLAHQFISDIFSLSNSNSYSFILPTIPVITNNSDSIDEYSLSNYINNSSSKMSFDYQTLSSIFSYNPSIPSDTLELLKKLNNRCLSLKLIESTKNNQKIKKEEWGLNDDKVKFLSKLIRRHQMNNYLPLPVEKIEEVFPIPVEASEKEKSKPKSKSTKKISDSLTQKELKELDELLNNNLSIKKSSTKKKKIESLDTSQTTSSKTTKEKKKKLLGYFQTIDSNFSSGNFDNDFISILNEFLNEYSDITKIFSLSNMTEEHLVYFFNFILKHYKDHSQLIVKVILIPSFFPPFFNFLIYFIVYNFSFKI